MELFLLLAVTYLFTLALGTQLEKLNIPWVFAALVFGLILAFTGLFTRVLESGSFVSFARLGMYFFLFVIGFEIDIPQIREKSGFIMKTTLAIILAETVLGGIFVHYVFGTHWLVALFVAHIFATVGEAALLPILEEFGLVDTELGQTVLGVATVDDTFEVLSVLLLPFIIGGIGGEHFSWLYATGAITLIGVLTGAAVYLDLEPLDFDRLSAGGMVLFALLFLTLFIYLGEFAHAAAIGALFAGVATDSLVEGEREGKITGQIKSMAYGLFGPLFFLWVGSDVTFKVPASLGIGFQMLSPAAVFGLLILAQLAVTNAGKIGGSLLTGWKKLGFRKSIFMGVSLAVKFSTSIVLIKILFEEGLIGKALYSVLIATKSVFVFAVPFLISYVTGWLDLDR